MLCELLFGLLFLLICHSLFTLGNNIADKNPHALAKVSYSLRSGENVLSLPDNLRSLNCPADILGSKRFVAFYCLFYQ